MSFEPQPTLRGPLLQARPLVPADHDALFAVAADPLIWEQHPDKTRSTREGFGRFFQGALDSGGALLVTDRATGAVLGSSRYDGYDPVRDEVEIGWTFLARSHWGGRYNAELKDLMLRHAFRYVARVVFLIDPANFRSQRAILKLGAARIADRIVPPDRVTWVFEIVRDRWPPGADPA